MPSTRTEPDVLDFLASRAVSLVFDVGANAGQYGEHLRRGGYSGRIVSFEPIAAVYDELLERARGDPLWETHRCGLGATRSRALINVSRSTVFSSILPSLGAAARFDPQSEACRTEEIEVETLDSFFAPYRSERAFLKIDTQGFERQVLAGASEALAHLCGIQMELPVIHLYAGVWTLPKALQFMANHDFVLSQASAVNYHSHDDCAVVELDCVFRRLSEIDG